VAIGRVLERMLTIAVRTTGLYVGPLDQSSPSSSDREDPRSNTRPIATSTWLFDSLMCCSSSSTVSLRPSRAAW